MKISNKIINFFIIGLTIALLAEFFRFYILAQEKLTSSWIIIIIAYLMIIALAYFTAKIIKNNLLYYITFGIFGLLLEIFWLNQLPMILSAGIFGWISWFSYWGTLALLPKLYLNKKIDKFAIFFIISSFSIFLIIYILTRFTGAMGLFFSSLNIVYIRQFIKDYN